MTVLNPQSLLPSPWSGPWSPVPGPRRGPLPVSPAATPAATTAPAASRSSSFGRRCSSLLLLPLRGRDRRRCCARRLNRRHLRLSRRAGGCLGRRGRLLWAELHPGEVAVSRHLVLFPASLY